METDEEDARSLKAEWHRLVRAGYDVDVGLNFAHLAGVKLDPRRPSAVTQTPPGRPRYEWLTWRCRRVVLYMKKGAVVHKIEESQTAIQVPVDA